MMLDNDHAISRSPAMLVCAPNIAYIAYMYVGHEHDEGEVVWVLGI